MPVSQPQAYSADSPVRVMPETGQPSQDGELPAGAVGMHADLPANSIRAQRYSWVKLHVPTGASLLNNRARRHGKRDQTT